MLIQTTEAKRSEGDGLSGDAVAHASQAGSSRRKKRQGIPCLFACPRGNSTRVNL